MPSFSDVFASVKLDLDRAEESKLKRRIGNIDLRTQGTNAGKRFSSGFTGAFAAVAAGGGVLAGLGLGKVGVDAVNLEKTFSQTMNTMAAVAKVPASGIKDLSDLAIKMGADTTFSASEAAEAMLELAKGGLSAATIQGGALEGTLTLAAAGGTDLATASTIASNALNTFGLKGKDMASVAAALAGGANASSASVESLGEALSQVGPGATTAGLTLQDTVGVLSSFDAAGIKGSDAGTSLKTMLTRLVPTTKAARTAMSDLGLKFTDANGAFVPITNVAEQLRQKLGKLSAEQQTTALSTIFGSDATRAATVLMKEGSAGLSKYIQATKDQNAAQEVAAARMSGTAGAWESFTGSVETAKLQLGLFLAPAVQAGLRKVTEGVNAIVPSVKALASILKTGDFTTAFREAFKVEEDSPFVAFLLNLRTVAISVFTTLKQGITAFVAAFKAGGTDITSSGFSGALEVLGLAARGVANVLTGQVLPAFAGFIQFLQANSTLVKSVAVGVGAMVVGFKAYHGVLLIVSAATKAYLAVQAAVAALWAATGIGTVILLLAGLAAGLTYAYKNSETFRNVVNGAFGAVRDTAVTVFTTIKNAVSTAIGFIRDNWKLITGILGGPVVAAVLLINTYWGQILGTFRSAASWVAGGFKAAWGAIVGVVSGPLNLALKIVRAIWPPLSAVLVLPVNIAKTLITAALTGIRSAFTSAREWTVGAFKAAWASVSGVLAGPVNIARTTISSYWAQIRATFTAAKDWAVGSFRSGWAAVTGAILIPVNLARSGLSVAWNAIRGVFTSAKDWALGAFAAAWAGLRAKITGPVDSARSGVSSSLTSLQGVFSRAVSAIGRIWDGLQELTKKPIRFIVNTVLNDGLIDSFNWVAEKFKSPTIGRIPLPQGFAEGGRIPGPPSSVDNLLARGPRGEGIGLATGEYIVNARQTQRNLPLLEAINAGMPGFADGGLFGGIKKAVTGAWSSGKELGGDVLGFLKDPVAWFKNRLSGPLGRLSELGDSQVANILKAVPRSLIDSVVGKAKDLVGLDGGTGLGGGMVGAGPNAPGLAGVLSWARAQVGKPYIWGGVGPRGYDCSGAVGAAINTAFGRNPHQRLGATGSMPWSMFAPGPGAFQVGWFKGNPGHTAATVNGVNIESRGGRGFVMGSAARGASDSLFTNRMHVRGFAQGGLFGGPGDPAFDFLDPRGKAFRGKDLARALGIQTHDSGGPWAPGTFSYNGTGKTETVRTAEQEAALQRAMLDGMTLRLDVPGVGVLNGHIVRTAADVYDEKARADAISYSHL